MTKYKNTTVFYWLLAFFILTATAEAAKNDGRQFKVTGNAQVKGLLIVSPQCTHTQLDNLDVKLNSFLPIGPNRKDLPTNLKELKAWCKNSFAVMKAFEKFIRQCFVKDARELSLMANYSIKNILRRYCKSKRSKATKEFLNVAGCVNKEILPHQPCVEMATNSTLSIIEINEPKGSKMKIPQMCCLYHRTMRCVNNFLDDVGCIKNHRQLVFDLVGSMSEQISDIACGDYNTDSSKCDSLPKLKDPDLSRHSSSYVMMMVELLNSMDSL